MTDEEFEAFVHKMIEWVKKPMTHYQLRFAEKFVSEAHKIAVDRCKNAGIELEDQ